MMIIIFLKELTKEGGFLGYLLYKMTGYIERVGFHGHGF